jgi:hypothetical protein
MASVIVVYVIGPYRGANAWEVENNIRQAEIVSMRAATRGFVPLCPHTMFRYFNGTLTEQWWLDATLKLLERCDAATCAPRWKESEGSRAEVDWCRTHNIPILDL